MFYEAKTIEQGVNLLLSLDNQNITGWKLVAKADDMLTDVLILPDGKKVPIFWWRKNMKYHGLYNVSKARIGSLCSCKTFSFDSVESSLKQLLLKEMDLAQWWLRSKIVKVTSMISDNKSGNFILKHDSGALTNLELSCTLFKNAERQSKHTIYATEGMVSDRVVDTMVVQNAVYLFNGESVKTYTDIESFMFGLQPEEVDKAFFIAEILKGKLNSDEFINTNIFIQNVLEKVCDAENNYKSVYVEV